MRKIYICIMLILTVCFLASCGKRESAKEKPEGAYYVYYISADKNSLTSEIYEPEGDVSGEKIITELKQRLASPADTKKNAPLLEKSVKINFTALDNTCLDIDFDSGYLRMDPSRQVLARAGMVRTYSQIAGVSSVLFTVDGEPIVDSEGNEIGALTADMFIENSGRDINTYEKDQVKLYFTDNTGQHLVREDRRIYHTGGQSLEWAVVERVIGGPKVMGHYSTIPANTEILSVTAANNVCYVNLSHAFIDNVMSNVNGKVTIYSIVNSLVESCKVDQVQLSVEGDMKITFKDNIKLDVPFEEDLSLVREIEEEPQTEDIQITGIPAL